ncbi:MAG: phage portal protein [Pseudomonadota bacterium]
MFNFLRRKSAKTIDQIVRELDDMFTGIGVTRQNALEVSTVFACIDILASGIATPELHVMRQLEDGRKQHALDDPVYRLLHRRPNEFQTSFEFRQMMTAHAALVGEAYALPVRDVRDPSKIIEILPFMPEWVTVDYNTRYEPRIRVQDEFGLVGEFNASQLLILRNMSWHMLRPLKPVQLASKAISLSMAAERNLTGLQENGGRPSGIIYTDGELSDAAVDRVKEGWRRVTSGSGRGGTALFDMGMKFQSIAMNAVDAETNTTRKLQIEEICRAFGVYPIMVGHSDQTATYASAEAFFAAHNRRTVKRWQRMWVEKLDEFVLDGSGPLLAQFDNQETQLATLRDQGEFFARALGSGGSVPFMTQNEVRELRGLGPVDGGDVIREPKNSTLEPVEGDDDE